jgi:hypothetical protein
VNIKAIAIEQFASFLLSGLTFKRIRKIVEAIDNKNLTGEQKRLAAIDGAKNIGIDLAGWLLNLGIELAVAWLKSKAEK